MANPERLWKAISGVIVSLLLTACAPRSADGPSLLLICADTVRADVFFNAGIEDSLTPWLQRSQRYTQAMSTSPWTMPAVASVLTGKYPIQHGGGAFEGPVANLDTDTPTALTEDIDTLAEILGGNGFATRGFSAHPWFKPGFGLDQGFENMVFTGGRKPLVDHLLEWIAELSARQRYFAYLHLMESHELHRRDEAEIRAGIANLDAARRQFLIDHANPAMCRKINGLRCARSQAYMASVLEMRESLAVLLESLDRTGRLDDTIVALYSDHGEEFREHREQHRAMHADPRGMYGVGHGQSHFRELLHVPLVMWRPGIPGAEHRVLASLVDLLPTALDWLGIDMDDNDLPGRVLPSGTVDSMPEARAVYASNIAFGPESIAIITDRTKAVYWPLEDRYLFFDRMADPAEKQPVESDALLIEFSTLAGDYLEMARPERAEAPKLGKSEIEELKAIGYLQGVEEDLNEEENP